MNPHASALGKLAKGIPKTLTPEQREFRRRQLEEARKKRWLVTKTKKPQNSHA